jgi:hypothetical protein
MLASIMAALTVAFVQNSNCTSYDHLASLSTGNQQNLGVRTLYLYGGVNNGTYLEDLWAWRLDEPSERWRKDFTSEAYYATGEGSDFAYHTDSPSKFYVSPDSDLSMLQKFWVPVNPDKEVGQPSERRIYLAPEKVQVMNSVGIKTIRDLAEVDLYTLLKLRGFDYPQVTPHFVALSYCRTTRCSTFRHLH